MRNLFAALCILVLPASAFAETFQPYFTIGGAYSFPSEVENPDVDGQVLNLENGFRIGGAVGMKIQDFRVEMEYAYRNFDMQDMDFENPVLKDPDDASHGVFLGDGYETHGQYEAHMLMWNGYYDIPVFQSRFINPFVGFGVGVAWKEADHKVIGDWISIFQPQRKTSFAYQTMVGNSIQLTDDLLTDISYRYIDADNVSASEIGFNFRYMF